MDFIKEKYGSVNVQVVNLDRATLKEAEDFKKILVKDIEEGSRHLIVDLTQCEFIDSTFLGALVVSLKKVTALGGDLKLVGFQPAVHSMFELTRMFRVFETFPTKDDAIKSYIG
ncbi:MAG: STAS domain-containing protein [Ignavibacteriales bacterium]|nr:STAS domain-containing protein [Ignavibacteriales bacterium]